MFSLTSLFIQQCISIKILPKCLSCYLEVATKTKKRILLHLESTWFNLYKKFTLRIISTCFIRILPGRSIRNIFWVDILRWLILSRTQNRKVNIRSSRDYSCNPGADETSASTDEDSSPDSERFHSMDVDSGNSTAHSPDGPKSMSPQPGHQGEFLRFQNPNNLHYE